jgi:hypothetical protein
MYVPSLRQTLISAGIAVGVAASGAVPTAQAAPSPGWRIVKILRHCGDDSMESVTSAGPRDAWALGAPNGPGCSADVEHWDGTSWRRVAVPRSVSLSPGPLGFTLGWPLAASSPTNAWIFPTTLAGSRGLAYCYALRWTGTAWRKSAFPAHLTVAYAAAFGPADAWAFGGLEQANSTTVPYSARYKGHAWRKAAVPVAPLGVSALSARDMWAVGPTPATAAKPLAKQVFLAARWNGRHWHTMALPAIRAPKGTASLSSGQVAAVGPDDIWWAYQVTTGEPSRTGLLRWQDRHWHAIKLPVAIGGIRAIAQDGRGGVWLAADAGTASYNLTQYLYHYNHGQWTRQLVPSPRGYGNMIFGMAWIPRTTSAWAVGEADRNRGSGTVGVIARYLR